MPQIVSTISSPEFINLEPLDINPLISQCEIKVFYLGKNRNNSFISKEVATEMSKTLRGSPIVGYFKESKEDFDDHGEVVTIDSDGIHFNCLTKPYGFVAPDAKVWFQMFEETDAFGNSIEREYLMTQGYLWTGQFPECQDVVDSGRPQSMELVNATGSYAEDPASGIEYYIINDAIFSKLCILGEDVEPCFEGSTITAPKFSLDKDFKSTLYSMMQDLQQFAKTKEGGKIQMELDKEKFTEETEEVKEIVEEVSEVSEEPAEPAETTEFTAEEETEETIGEIADTSSEGELDATPADPDPDPTPAIEDSQEYQALKQSFDELQQKYDSLKEEADKLEQFRLKHEREDKQKLIDKFTSLSEEEKQDCVDNIDTYTLSEIDAKLSMIFAHKETDKVNTQGRTVQFTEETSSTLPAWIQAVQEEENK